MCVPAALALAGFAGARAAFGAGAELPAGLAGETAGLAEDAAGLADDAAGLADDAAGLAEAVAALASGLGLAEAAGAVALQLTDEQLAVESASPLADIRRIRHDGVWLPGSHGCPSRIPRQTCAVCRG